MAEESPYMLVQPQTSSSSPADPSPAAAARPRSFESARPCDDPSLASATTSTPASSSARHPQPQSFSHPSDRPQKPSQHSPAPPHSATAAPDSDEKERSPTPNEKAGSTTDVEEEDRSLSSNGKATDVEKSNNALKPPDDGLPAQDTSWQAWLVVFGCFVSLFATFGATNGFGVFVSYYVVAYPATSPAIISLIGGVQVGTLFACGPMIGVLYDSYGPFWILLAGTAAGTVSYMVLSVTNAIWQIFLLQGVMMGISIGCFFITAVALLPNWFVRYRAAAIGCAVSGGSVGGVLWPIIVRRLIAQVGFAWMARISGFITLACLMTGTLLMKQRSKPPGKRRLTPNFALLKRPAFCSFFFSIAFGYFGLFGVVFFISQRGINIGIDPSLANYLISILNAGSVVGRILPGYLADIIGPLNMVIMATALSVLWIAALWIPANSTGVLIACALLYGYSSGSWVSVCPAAVPRLAGLENLGASMGLIYLSSVPGALSGASIGSAVVNTSTGTGYIESGGIWIAFTATSMSLALLTRYLVVGPKLFVKV